MWHNTKSYSTCFKRIEFDTCYGLGGDRGTNFTVKGEIILIRERVRYPSVFSETTNLDRYSIPTFIATCRVLLQVDFWRKKENNNNQKKYNKVFPWKGKDLKKEGRLDFFCAFRVDII